MSIGPALNLSADYVHEGLTKLDIDVVILWVDGSDPEWLEDFITHSQNQGGDKRKSRYRDWNNLKFLFRSFETCMPWVRKIHFVTYGHLPSWLNVECEKINIVKHSDFLDKDYLPVFNANPIEVNLHRIEGLAERFIFFNDDMFVLKSLRPDHFFKKNLPCDLFAFNAISDSKIAHIKINDIQILHKYFDKPSTIKKNFFKIFNWRTNFLEILKTLLLIPWPKITGFYDHHMPQPFLKKTFEEVWAAEGDVLKNTSASKIRNSADVNQYLFRYWQLCNGDFFPASYRNIRFEWVRNYEDAVEVKRKINSGRYRMFCINDDISEDDNFDRIRDKVNEAFELIFPDKSRFEK